MQHAKLAQQSFISRAQVLAHVMTKTSNVKVTVSGNTAYCDNGHINLPAGDFTDKEWVEMVQGWIDHELGHENHTDHHVYTAFARKGMLQANLLNICEDVWMEREVGKRFRGARTNLARLAELAVKRELFADPSGSKHPLSAVTALLLFGGRSRVIGQTCLNEYAAIAKTEVEKHFGAHIAQQLDSIVDELHGVVSTAGAIDVAQKVIDLLQQQQQQQQQNQDQEENDAQASDDSQQGQSGEDESDEQDDSNGSDASAQSDGSEDESTDETNTPTTDENSDEQGEGQGDGAEAEQDAGAEPQASDAKGQASPQQPTPEQIADALEKALNDAANADIQDFHEALAKALGEEAEEQQQAHPERCAGSSNAAFGEDGKDAYRINGCFVDAVLATRISGAVYQTMHKVLFDQVQSLPVRRKSGTRLDGRRLSGIPAGNLNVFTRHVEQTEVKAAVSVLIDASGSMSADDDHGVALYRHANACALAFAKGLDKAGVASEFIYYSEDDGSHYQMYTAKRFDQKPKADAFGVYPSSSTPTGQGMEYALSSLVLRPEEKRMLIVLTDGDPNDPHAVLHARRIAEFFGIKVVPIGICTKVVAGFDEGEFVVVNNPAELPNALRQAVKLKLFS